MCPTGIKGAAALALLALIAATAAVACGGGGKGSSSGSATPAASGASSPTPVTPPLEGPPRTTVSQKRTNYRDDPNYQLPGPDGLPSGSDQDGQIYHPPANPQCPQGWKTLERPTEGFTICYPDPWTIQGYGYVSAGFDDRWLSVGIFLYKGDAQVAHVSVYVTNAYAQPFLYTKDCKQDYQVTFAGEQAVLCPDHPGVAPEVQISTYHIRKNDLDYFVNVVPHYDFDPASGKYLDSWDKSAAATAVQIAQTFQFIPLVAPSPSASPPPASSPPPSP